MVKKNSTTKKDADAKKNRQERLGSYLAQLREEKKFSLQKVSQGTGISDPFLYQLEKGERALTNPLFFNKIASFYEIDVRELLRRAGYLPEEDLDQMLDQAMLKIVNDKNFQLKATLFAKMTFQEKIDLATVYEKASGKKILGRGLELFQ